MRRAIRHLQNRKQARCAELAHAVRPYLEQIASANEMACRTAKAFVDGRTPPETEVAFVGRDGRP
jgi:hypothetical protein